MNLEQISETIIEFVRSNKTVHLSEIESILVDNERICTPKQLDTLLEKLINEEILECHQYIFSIKEK